MTLTLGSRSHKMLASTLHIMWPMHLRSLKLLCPMVKEKMHLQEIHYLTLTLGSSSHEVLPSTLDIMWPMHMQNLKLLLPKVYKEMRLQENKLSDPWPWGQGHTKCHPVPFTSCDLPIDKVWSCYVQRFRRRYNYTKLDGPTDGRRIDFGTKLIYSMEKAGIKIPQNEKGWVLHFSVIKQSCLLTIQPQKMTTKHLKLCIFFYFLKHILNISSKGCI